MKTSIGVIVARFQVHELHAGHRHLIESVQEKHAEVLIVLGSSPVLLSRRDPLDFETRKLMVQHAYPTVRVVEHLDHPSNDAWSKGLDARILESFPGRTAVLYGSRGSFITAYSGTFPTTEIEAIDSMCGTELREQIRHLPQESRDFRRGAIYAAYHRFPTAYAVVDVAIYRPETDEVLLGRKMSDGDKWRFIGGFVDPNDISLEQSARREVYEETGVEAESFTYVGSTKVEDWRYRGREDSVLSTLFIATYMFGKPMASDDIAEVKWYPRESLELVLVASHEPLGALLRKHFNKTN